jgi:hypothetical protein
MIEKFEDLDLKDEDTIEQVEVKVQEKLGLSIIDMKTALSEAVIKGAEELTLEFVNMAPLGDYSRLLEDNDSMAEFLKSEGHKTEHWKLYGVKTCNSNDKLITFEFANLSVDEGEALQGFVYVSVQGKIKHAFAQNSDN